jgi:hypothetical protein
VEDVPAVAELRSALIRHVVVLLVIASRWVGLVWVQHNCTLVCATQAVVCMGMEGRGGRAGACKAPHAQRRHACAPLCLQTLDWLALHMMW